MRILLALMLVLGAATCADEVLAAPAPDSAAVKAVVDDFARVWETQDMALFSRIIAHDADFIAFGTDPDEYFVGWSALRESIAKMMPSLRNAKLAVTDQVIKVRPGARVAWFTELVTWDYDVDGKPIHQNCRFSGVLERRHGTWLFVQFHNSVPATG